MPSMPNDNHAIRFADGEKHSVEAPALELLPALTSYSRPWCWPFEGKRFETTRALQVALFFVVAAVAARAVASLTLGLTDDEAWYWALAQTPQWSYAVHPPLSMWLLHVSTAIFGNTQLAVRLPAIVCSTLATFWLIRLAARMGWAKGTDAIAILCLTCPLLFLGGVLSGPDLPLFPLWIAIMEQSFAIGMGYDRGLKAWSKLGFFSGFALLSKYTGILAIIAGLLWLVSAPHGRRCLRTPLPWVSALIAAAIFSPVILWNVSHGWVSFNFQFVSRHSGASTDMRRWLLFWFSQCLLYGPAVVLGWFALVKRAASTRPPAATVDRLNYRFLAIFAIVPGSIFFIQPLYSPFKIHWALFAFVPVLVYFAKLSASATAPGLLRRAVSHSTALTLIGLSLLYFPIVPMLSMAASNPDLGRGTDVTSDFYGWDRLGDHLASLPSDSLAAKTLPLVANRYQVAAQAAFALGERARVRLLPHDSAETRDWGGDPAMPAAFVFVTDARYGETAAALYPGYECTALPELRVSRGSYLTRRILLESCVAKAMAH